MNFRSGFKYAVITAAFFVFGAQVVSAQTITVPENEKKAIEKIDSAKDFAAKAKAAAEFLKKFPQSKGRIAAADKLYLAAWVKDNDTATFANYETFLKIFTETAERDFVMSDYLRILSNTNLESAIEQAPAFLERYPENLFLRYHLAIVTGNQLLSGNAKFADYTNSYATESIDIIEADKKPKNESEESWQDYKTKKIGVLYQYRGIFNNTVGSTESATEDLEKSLKINPKLTNSWIVLGQMADSAYQKKAEKYNSATGAAKAQLMQEAMAAMDECIDYYAHVLALTEGDANAKNIYDGVRPLFEQYFKYRKKTLDGAQKLIDSYKK